MANIQISSELFRNLSIISEDETALKKAVKYIGRLAKQLSEDTTKMSKDEYFAMLDRAEQQYANGEYTVQQQGESVTDMLKRCGYAL